MKSLAIVGCLILLTLLPGQALAFHTVLFNSPLSEGEDLDVLVQGYFPDTCYLVDSSWTTREGDLLTFEIQERVLQNVGCLLIIVDYEVPAVFSGLEKGKYTLRVIEYPFDPTGMGLFPPQVEEFEVKVVQAIDAEGTTWGTIKATYR